jgi:hypothetical protein
MYPVDHVFYLMWFPELLFVNKLKFIIIQRETVLNLCSFLEGPEKFVTITYHIAFQTRKSMWQVI